MIDYSTIPDWSRRRTETLARMWRELNVGKWPAELGPEQEPEHGERWALMLWIAETVGERWALMLWIAETVGQREIVRIQAEAKRH